MQRNHSNVIIFAAGIALGSILCFLTMKLSGPAVHSRRTAEPEAFFLGVSVTFPNIEDKILFQNEFIPLSEYVRSYEPKTISYELLQSDKEPLQIFILERYVDKNAYLLIHKQSKEFIVFRERFQKIIERGARVDGHSYLETGIGFI